MNYNHLWDKPTLTVDDVKFILCIGTNSAYKLLKSNAFPVKRLNNKFIIPTSSFKKWLDNEQSQVIKF